MFRILHISDLHVKPPRTLDEMWGPVDGHLQDEKFDFIVASGDLTERASAPEYGALHDLAEKDLIPRLVDADPARIIFVPGNHDVEWNDAHYTFRPWDIEAARAFERNPHASQHRVARVDTGHVHLWELNKPEHAKRMANVQTFFDKFYGSSLSGKHHKKFAIARAGQDWSCHAFMDAGIAFVGLNSCSGNDKFWHGARLEPAALRAATRHVRTLRKQNSQLIVVAVWHHGFASALDRPDRLTLSDIGSVFSMGAHLGLHGHTHVAEGRHHELLDGRLPIVAAGSLGAGREGLPDGTPNQFGIIEVNRKAVRVETLRLDHQEQRYASHSNHTFAIASEKNGECAAKISCVKHTRVCKINADGVKQVRIALTQVDAGEIPLAMVVPPYCAVASGGKAEADAEKLDVVKTELAGDKHRYSVVLRRKTKSLKWNYFVSNSAALTAEELELLPNRAATYPNIMPSEDACSYVVNFECESLELAAEFERAPALKGAHLLVERQSSEGAASSWEADDAEMERWAGSFSTERLANGGNVIRLVVGNPIVGQRYSLVFEPGNEGHPYPRDARDLALSILQECRGQRYELAELCKFLTKSVNAAIAQVLGSEIGEWSGHIWNWKDRALLAAFGHFASQGWSSYFEAGTGVAGHAFRHGSTVGWRDDRDDLVAHTQCIYRPGFKSPGQGGAEYKWVLCVPLRLTVGGPAIGVVGFARSTSRTLAERLCESYVSGLPSDASRTKLLALETAVATAFWLTVSSSSTLPEPQRAYAQSIFDSLSKGSVPPGRLASEASERD